MKINVLCILFILLVTFLWIGCNFTNRPKENSNTQLAKQSEEIENQQNTFIEMRLKLNEWIKSPTNLFFPIVIKDSTGRDSLKGHYFLTKRLKWLLLVIKKGNIINEIPLIPLSYPPPRFAEKYFLQDLFPSPKLMWTNLKINRKLIDTASGIYRIDIVYNPITHEVFDPQKDYSQVPQTVTLLLNIKKCSITFSSTGLTSVW